MDTKLFNELLKSIKQAGKIHRGQAKPTRKFDLGAINVRSIRERMGLSQANFALVMGVSIRTLQNWEQGHRHPQGPALALLTIFKNDPEHAMTALHKAS